MNPTNYDDLLKSCKIDSNTIIKDDNIYLAINNNIVGSAGNFIAFTGLPGSSKSTFIAGLIASAISKSEIFDFNALTYPAQKKTRICLFDTEQTGLDYKAKERLIKKLSGKKDIYKNLDVFSVVEFSSNTILNLINTYLTNTPECAILIIDGILDCIEDMNDQKQAKRLIKIIRKWAKKYDILIVIVLHLGKKDLTAIGHIGSASTRYCQSELEISKTKNGTYCLTPKKLRSAGNFDSIEIMYSEIEKTFIKL
jgi:predicted ATP-dependent serine protease